LYELANDPASSKFAGIESFVAMPVIILYLLLGYWTFRGKTRRAVPMAPSPASAARKTCGNNVDLHLS
jgi:hypothetical protein